MRRAAAVGPAPRRAIISVLALGVLVYAVLADQIVGFSGGDINVFVVQGVVLTASAVALVSQNQESIGAALGGCRQTAASSPGWASPIRWPAASARA